jgi:ribonucleoside-diphosphate reductase alpha chain
VRKRSGKLERFDKSKIEKSLHKVMAELNFENKSKEITEEVINFLKAKFSNLMPSTKDIRDVVEDVLIKKGMVQAARAYVAHGSYFEENINELKGIFNKSNLKLSENAWVVLKKRYLQRDKYGNIIESPEQMFARVAKHVASCEKEKKKWEDEYYSVMVNLEFLPNTPCLVNAGRKLGQLSACFVLEVPDSMDGIFESLKDSAKIFQSGGGVGYSFSSLRERGGLISSTNREASGPISFMQIFDKTSEVIKQGGVRRGASMGVLRFDHPDIFQFIAEKSRGGLTNFNLSIGVTDEFMKEVIKNKNFYLRDNKGRRVRKINAREMFDYLCTHAWESGDPGMLFLDEINRQHPLRKLGRIESTNPCAETTLLPNEACVLGSINLTKFVRSRGINWSKLAKTVEIGVRFLDDVVTVNRYPTKEIEKMCLANRKIGLGIMGWADLLIELGIKYDSEKAVHLAKEVMKFIKKHAELTSEKLGREKGAFENYKKSSLKKRRRNATLLSIAPTGSISIIAGCSSGIEPLFGLAYVREVLGGVEMFEANEHFENYARYKGFYSKELMVRISQEGSVQGISEVPKEAKQIFVTALDIPLEWHVQMQSAFQEEVDNAVSKTINLPSDATIGDVKRAYMLAWKAKCKGITIYRYGSKDKQVLYLGRHLQKLSKKESHTWASAEYSGGCMHRECHF